MKKLRTTIRWVIWTIAGLYLTAIVLLHIPVVQDFLAQKVGNLAGDKLGTEVHVGRIDLGFINRFVLDDILIYDQSHKKMLSASRIGARVDIWHLLRTGEINISSAQIFGLQAELYKTSKDAKPNFQFALDSLASKDTTSHTPLHLSINSLVVRHGSIKYDCMDAPTTPNRLNLNHINLTNISSYIILHKLDDTSVWANLRSLAFKEASGLEVKQLAFDLNANQKQANLRNFVYEGTNSKITLKALLTTYKFNDKKLDINTLRYDLQSLKAQVKPSDFAPLLPELRTITTNYTAAIDAKGTNQSVVVKQLNISDPSLSTHIKANGWIKNIQEKPTWDFTFSPLKVNKNTLLAIAKVAHQSLPKPLSNIGNINYRGSFAHSMNKYSAKGLLNTEAGNVQLATTIHGKNIQGTINTTDLNLAKVLDNNDFGTVNTNIKVEGNTDLTSIIARGDVSSFYYKGYTYKNIHLDGSYKNDILTGKAAIHDPNGKLDIDGKAANIMAFIQQKGKLSTNVTITADAVNLHKLQLTEALGNRTISFTSKIKGQGRSLNDVIGNLDVKNFTMIGEGQNITLNQVNINANNGLLGKSLDAQTDFGELHLVGQYDYEALPQSIMRTLEHYLPSLIQAKSQYPLSYGKANYAFTLRLNDTKLLNSLLKTPITSSHAMRLTGIVRERQHELDLNVNAPDVTYKGQQIKKLLLNINSEPQGLVTTISAERKGEQGPHILINAQGLIADNTISSDISFRIPGQAPIYGNINSEASFSRLHGDLKTRLHLNPSKINFDSITLQVQPSDISYHRNYLTIDHFELSNNNQHIIANGQTSGNQNDSILVRFKDVNVPYILNLVNFHSVSFAGTASGIASIKSFFHHPLLQAKLEVQNFQFENGDLGTLYADANYNDKEGKINIDAYADGGDGTRTDIKGYVDIKKSYINLPIFANNSHLYFLKTFCGSFMDNIEIQGNGWCKVIGPLSAINLEGDMQVNGSVHVMPIGVTYTMRDARVRIIPNEIIFGNDTITDSKGNIGIVTGGLHHTNLTHLTYDINIFARNLLSYNFPKKLGKESFWGMVYATGKCNIKGEPGSTTMNIDVKLEKNTYITYDASLTNDAGTNNFIRWINLPKDSTGVLIPEAADTLSFAAKPAPKKNNTKIDFDDIPSDLQINCLVRTNPNLTLGVLLDDATGDNIRLNGSGIIRATYYNKGAFQLFGNYNVEYGQYNLTIQNIIKKQFVFQPGSTIAFGGDPFNAALNLKANYFINSVPLGDLGLGRSFTANNTKVNCLLNIEGTPGAPTVSFGLDLPTLSPDAQQMIHSILNSEQELNQQVLYLLAVGRFYPQSNNNNTARNSGSPSRTSLAMQSLLSGTISQQINTVLSNVVKDNNWNFGANIATGNEGFDNAEYEGLLSGSMLNNRLLFNGQFGYRNNVAKDKASFIGDFDIRYLLFPSGNVAFHVYNQTNDRYFTRNSLTTQGIGLILKKDFNRLSDIFGSRKKKTKKEKQKH